MKIIKKSDKLTLRQMREIELAEDQLLQSETVPLTPPAIEQPVPVVPEPEPNYIPLLDNPPVQSVGNSGWQVSDVWRDLRVDSFCD
ncbi:hypothetical protein H6G80_25020 [Nostoc sp. FACHB-87]|uniref:hypothetical protein n=1 Tax=Nostocales TaxID=1161 RepID=UPI0016833355|nr:MULTISPECIES: hypothetical protein [Nostocales]MBD2303474.1 hypothetical protein [Nostoc sp. FACHB-190]MBD2457325.1 hypothetical protein [Nostoc sp. FACHB-87]MBD2478394.1 hypothetical protein [Anabaena sp. FACHB-83]MBD2491216.1 hypothetical protein [Aulosira sp. FACHB-615]